MTTEPPRRLRSMSFALGWNERADQAVYIAVAALFLSAALAMGGYAWRSAVWAKPQLGRLDAWLGRATSG